MNTIRWGILGTGGIASRFAESLLELDGAQLVAVGSRTPEGADKFGARFGAEHRFGSYQELAECSQVDAIYVATPHTLHYQNTLMALRHGKAVLCEKPFALNAAQAQAMIAEARQRQLFLMEAMWTRFQPSMEKVREVVQQGLLGQIEQVQADFGREFEFLPQHRTFNPELGGGSLLDLGVYNLSFASMVLGAPQNVDSQAVIGETGIDEETVVWLEYASGAQAELTTSMRRRLANSARIYGSDGYLEVTPEFWKSRKLVLVSNGQEQHIATPFAGHGDQFQALEVHRCLAQGRTESAIMPLDETLSIMQTMDQLRAQWGLHYPGQPFEPTGEA